MMNEQFLRYVNDRCNHVNDTNEKIKQLELDNADFDLIRIIAEQECYIQGYIDAINIRRNKL